MKEDFSQPEPTNETKSFFKETAQFVLVAVAIALPIRFFVAQPFIVRGDSMLPTFKNSQYLIIDQLSYRFNEPERGDIVVLHNPLLKRQYNIKRVIGLPNETVTVKNSAIHIKQSDGVEFDLEEPYVTTSRLEASHMFELGPDEYFVAGDNRSVSADSRNWGALKRKEIAGRVFIRLWPPTKIGIFPGKATYEVSATQS